MNLTTWRLFLGIQFSRIPGHKVTATIDMTDKGVMEWRAPQGWPLDGMADIVAIAIPDGVVILLPALALRIQAFPMMMVMLTT